MRQSDFPRYFDAPEELKAIEGSCGPIAAWQVLRYFGREVIPGQLLADCRFDAVVGVYAIGLAVALAQRELRVHFYTDTDPAPSVVEQLLYADARKLGVTMHRGVSLEVLDEAICQEDGAGIILYETPQEAHFTPFLGLYNGELIMPNEGDALTIEAIEMRRAAAGILRQAIVAGEG